MEAAEVGPEAGSAPATVPVAVAGTVRGAVPGPRNRHLQSSDSGCAAEAAVAEAGGRKEGQDSGRSLLAWLLMDCPAGVEGAQCRAGVETGQGSGGLRILEVKKIRGTRDNEENMRAQWQEQERKKWRDGKRREGSVHTKEETFENFVGQVKRI